MWGFFFFFQGKEEKTDQQKTTEIYSAFPRKCKRYTKQPLRCCKCLCQTRVLDFLHRVKKDCSHSGHSKRSCRSLSAGSDLPLWRASY